MPATARRTCPRVNAIPRSLILYVAITYALSAIYGFSLPLLGLPQGSPWMFLLSVLYMFIPALVAVGFTRREKGSLRGLGVKWRFNPFWLVSWLAPLALVFLGIGLSLLMPGASFSPGLDALMQRLEGVVPADQLPLVRAQLEQMPVHPVFMTLPQALIAGATINAVAAFGEELGWRGYMQQKLAHLGFWRSNALIGVVWGLWHAPLILQGHNYPDAPVAGVLMMIVVCVPLSILFAWTRVRGRSVVPASIAHGSFNALAGLSTMVMAGGSSLLSGMMGLGTFLAASILCAAILFFDRKVESASRAEFDLDVSLRGEPARLHTGQ